jgi:very-short-patch-repair endonuclease
MKGKKLPVVWTEERRKSKSEEKKKLYREHPEAHPNRKLANNKTKMSYPEKLVYEKLEDLQISFEHQKKIGKRYVDFYLIATNTIVEVDGERWHQDAEKDRLRDEEIRFIVPETKIIHLQAKRVLEELTNKVLI